MSDTVERYARRLAVRWLGEAEMYASGARRAPKGGISIKGKQYRGGMWVPGEVVAQADDATKAKLGATGGGTPAPAKAPAAKKAPQAKPKAPATKADLVKSLEGHLREGGHQVGHVASKEKATAARSWGQLKSRYGDKALARLGELAALGARALARLKDGDPGRQIVLREMAKLHHIATQLHKDTPAAAAAPTPAQSKPPAPEEGGDFIPLDMDDLPDVAPQRAIPQGVKVPIAPAKPAKPTSPISNPVTPKAVEYFPPSPRIEKHTVESKKKETDSNLKTLLGRVHKPEDLTALTGAPPGSTLKLNVLPGGKGNLVHISVSGGGVEMDRVVMHDDTGKLVVKNEWFGLEEGMPTGSGLGARLFHQQVSQSAALGADRIETLAAGSKDADMNGYYTWPRLGYDGPLTDWHKENLPEAFREANTIQELLAMPGGSEAWKEHGSDIELTFDVKEGSRNRKLLDAYIVASEAKRAARAGQPERMARAPEDVDHDEAILDALWDLIAREGWGVLDEVIAGRRSLDSGTRPQPERESTAFPGWFGPRR